MFKLSRRGDFTQNLGKIVRGARTVRAEFLPVGLHPSQITPHPKKKRHKRSFTTRGSSTVFVERFPVLLVGIMTSCGHRIISGCRSIFVGR